jgi:Ca-activated chloride channel family protein
MMNQKDLRSYLSILLICVLALFSALSASLILGTPQEKRDIPESEATLKVNVDLVNVILTVTEGNGRIVPGLNREDFLVEEDGRKQEVSHFAREVTLPLTLALLIDTSPSVQPVLDLEKQTAIEFLHSILRKEDLALVMNFDRGVSLVQDFTPDIRRLSKAIQSVAIGGGTSVHDAVFLACDEKLKRETGRKAIILISDGGDTTSKLKIKDAIESAQRADVIIYAISNSSGGPFFGGGGDDGTLKRYAEATGGRAFFPSKPQDFKKAFEAIQEELRSQYILSYSSTNTMKDGSYRALKISVPNQKNLKVRTKKGYYASKG